MHKDSNHLEVTALMHLSIFGYDAMSSIRIGWLMNYEIYELFN